MAKYDFLIIGGGIAGVTAAETVRELLPDASVGIISDEPHPLYSRVLLPSYCKRRIGREKVFLRSVNDFTKARIDLRLNETVGAVDGRAREAKTISGETLGFKKLLIASGGKPVPWGNDEDGNFIYRFQTLDDADRLFRSLGTLQTPLVVGASFIGLELLEIFALAGARPTLLARDPHYFSQFLDARGGEILYRNFAKHGIAMQFGDEIAEITAGSSQLSINTKGMRRFGADAVAVGVGVARPRKFLEGSGVALGERGVLTNEFLETSAEGIYAAGDIAEFRDIVRGTTHTDGNWTSAFLQGRRAGLNMAGRREPFRNLSSYSITNFGYQITVLGDTEDVSDTIVRTDIFRGTYERLFFRNGFLVGAALINRFAAKPLITKLIISQTPMGEWRDKLADPAFDIASVAPIK